MATVFFLKDCLELLSYLCKSLQWNNYDATVKLEATVASLSKRKENNGVAFMKFQKQIPADPPQDGNSLFLDQEITDTAHQRAAAQDIRKNIIASMIARLETWFPKEDKIGKSLAVLDPSSLT